VNKQAFRKDNTAVPCIRTNQYADAKDVDGVYDYIVKCVIPLPMQGLGLQSQGLGMPPVLPGM